MTENVDAEQRLRAAEKMQAVGTLASGVAHDFNNLLAAILLHARLLQRQPDAVADAASAIRVLAEEGSEVVRELLFFAQRESSPPSTFDLGELVRQQEGVLRHLLASNIELVLELDRETVPVRGDVIGLRRLLLNLVLNARDAVGETGGGIAVRVVYAAGRAVLEVEDDGPGIAPEVRARLFEPFFTLRRQGRGSGLRVGGGLQHRDRPRRRGRCPVATGGGNAVHRPSAPRRHRRNGIGGRQAHCRSCSAARASG